MAHLHAVPDPDDDPRVDARDETPEPIEQIEPVDPAAAVAPDESLVPAVGEDGAPFEEERRYPSTIGGAFYLSILAVAGAALMIATRSDWRLGIKVLGGAMIVGALLRLVLANRDAGMLAVRNRFIDAFLLGGAGIGLITLATTIRDMPLT